MTTDVMTAHRRQGLALTAEEADQATARETHAIAAVAQRLRQRFPQVDAATVEATVALTYHRFDESRIRDFVPIFVERGAREELSTLTT